MSWRKRQPNWAWQRVHRGAGISRGRLAFFGRTVGDPRRYLDETLCSSLGEGRAASRSWTKTSTSPHRRKQSPSSVRTRRVWSLGCYMRNSGNCSRRSVSGRCRPGRDCAGLYADNWCGEVRLTVRLSVCRGWMDLGPLATRKDGLVSIIQGGVGRRSGDHRSASVACIAIRRHYPVVELLSGVLDSV